MNHYFYWIFGSLVVLNFCDFLFALFDKRVLSISSQRGWAHYILLVMTVNAIVYLGYFASDNPYSYNELCFWLCLGVVSTIFSVLSISVRRRRFMQKIFSGVYQFKVNYKTQGQKKIYGEFDSGLCQYPLPAELQVDNYDDYQWDDVISVVVKSCYYDVWDWLYDEGVDIKVAPKV